MKNTPEGIGSVFQGAEGRDLTRSHPLAFETLRFQCFRGGNLTVPDPSLVRSQPTTSKRNSSITVTELFLSGAEGRDRTGDTTIFSRVLYQLSYLGVGGRGVEPLTFTMSM